MGLKDTKSVVSLNFLKGAGLKCPINHSGWRTPKSPQTKRFQLEAFEKGDWWIYGAGRICRQDRTEGNRLPML